MSILKSPDESNRLQLKQVDTGYGTKQLMLQTTRNDSLTRFTKELQQHQIPANKKLNLHISPLQSGVLSSKEPRKKVNFDLPLIVTAEKK